MRAKRNKTLTINDDERPCLTRDITCLDQIGDDFLFDNKTINADILDVLPLMPDDYADLIIIDPPYNLSKDFDMVRFTPMSDEARCAANSSPRGHYTCAATGDLLPPYNERSNRSSPF